MFPISILFAIAFVILVLIGYSLFKDYKKANPEDRRRLFKIYLVCGFISIVLIVGIRLLNIPQKIFPNYIQQAESKIYSPEDILFDLPANQSQ